jgi:hypothetical protein
VVDDSKTVTKFGDALVTELHTLGIDVSVLSQTRRGCADLDYGVAEDRFIPSAGEALAFVRR